jgi:hypothetical protein
MTEDQIKSHEDDLRARIESLFSYVHPDIGTKGLSPTQVHHVGE